jgi:hypothetical protein
MIPQNRPGNAGGIASNRPGTPSTLPSRPSSGFGSGIGAGLGAGIGAGIGSGLIGSNRPGLGGGASQLPAQPGIGDGNRPGIGNRPGDGIGNRPGDGIGNRPGDGLVNRPGGGGSGERWRPGDNRPGGDGDRWRPGDNRPGGGGDGDRWRPGDNRPNGGGDRWNPGQNRPGIGNGSNNWWANQSGNRFNQFNQNNVYASGYGGYGGYGAGYGAYGGYGAGYGGYGYGGYGGYGSYGYGDYSQPWYDGFYESNYSNWGAPLAAWAVSTGANWLADGSQFVYSNPYYDTSTTTVQPVYNYAEPIVVQVPVQQTDATVTSTDAAPAPIDTGAAPTVTAPPPAAQPPADPKIQAASDAFASARDAFKVGDYVKAQSEVERAIKLVPDDPVLHEFRALTLFAQAKYKEAAATLYAVLARGPGWDWNTMRSLYPDVDTYTRQLRALEGYIRDHGGDSAARFVLAYHYLVAHQTDAAVRQLQEVVKLTPDNALASDMVKALTAQPAANAPPKPGQ